MKLIMTPDKQTQNTVTAAKAPRPDCAPATSADLLKSMRQHLVERQSVYDALGRA